MSYLNPAEDWERLQAADPLLAAVMATPGNLFLPPPWIDPFMAYARVLAACAVIWLHVALIAWVAS